MKLSDWAKKQGISYLTAYRWFKDGKLPVEAYQSDSGTIIVKDESDNSEQAMAGSTVQNDAMSLFLKKTVEFSKNNSTVEDFAAYVLSNFQLQLNNVTTGPKYSKNRPKSEDVQKHFQQFIPKGEKPKPNSFVIEPDKLDELAAKSDLTPEALVEEIQKAANQDYTEQNGGFIKYGDTPADTTTDMYQSLAAAFAPDGRRDAPPTTNAASVYVAATVPAVEGIVSRSVDFNTTPQQINYTGSTSYALNNSLSSSVISGDIGGSYPAATVQTLGLNSADSGSALLTNNSMTFSATKLPEIASAIAEPPRARRGRPSKKNKV